MGGQCCKFDMENEGNSEMYGQRLKINLSCYNLVSGGHKRHSCDTAAILYAQGTESKKWTCIYETDPVIGSNDPVYAENIIITFMAERQQIMKVEIMNVTECSMIGMAEFDLNQMISKRLHSIFLKNKEYEDMIMGKVLINAVVVGGAE